jgi:hypothetical protein
MEWDVFISHASEDKSDVARPLSQELEKAGLRVWLDENELRLTDSLRGKIDQGLAKSRFGVVIISHAFLGKDWPERELDGLASLETGGRKVIMPIWHNVDHEEVAKHSPTLAARFSVSTSIGIEAVGVKVSKDVYHFIGQNVFDDFYESDREWFLNILKTFNRPAFRGRYVGWSGHEPFQKVIKGIIKTLNAGDTEGNDPAENKRDMSRIRDQRLFASMLGVSAQLKTIDNLIQSNLPYPGNGPNVVTGIDRLRDDIIIRMNSIWAIFRIHTLPIELNRYAVIL